MGIQKNMKMFKIISTNSEKYRQKDREIKINPLISDTLRISTLIIYYILNANPYTAL